MKEESEEAADPCLKLHHGAFEFATLDELLGSYTMVKALGIGPDPRNSSVFFTLGVFSSPRQYGALAIRPRPCEFNRRASSSKQLKQRS